MTTQMSNNKCGSDVTDKQLQDAKAALEYTTGLLFHRHRGILDLDDKFVLFENGRYDYSKTIGELLQQRLTDLGCRFAFAGELYWAAVVYNYDQSRTYGELADILGAIVADTRQEAVNEN